MSEPLYYPKCVFDAASDEEREDIIAGNAKRLDFVGANLLHKIADCEAGLWADRAHAARCRRVLRQVADWLETRP